MFKVGDFEVGDKVRVTRGENEGGVGIIEKFEEISDGTFATLDVCKWRGHSVDCLELVKEKDMEIKINRKAPMGYVEQREAFFNLMSEYRNEPEIHSCARYLNKAMEICNNPQEIESIEIILDKSICIAGELNKYCYMLTLDQYNQIKAAVEGGKESE